MRALWLAFVGVLLLAPTATADPWVTSTSAREGLATWAFSNPQNYTLSNVSLSTGRAVLSQTVDVPRDTAQNEFAQALIQENIDTAGQPGNAVLRNTSQEGPANTLSYRPTSAELEDNYLWSGGGANGNFGVAPNLFVGYWGNPEWTRTVLRWQALPLPSNATLVSAQLDLYMHTADTPDPMDISIHRMTTGWTEFGSSWNDYDGSNPWNTSGGGGDFDTAVIDAVPGITTAAGWYTWNVTSIARDWWTGTTPNHGILVRQMNDDLSVSLGRKEFYSSDAPNTSLRPRLVLLYTTPSSAGTLESRVLGPGTASTWRYLWWNVTLPPGTGINVQTRTGYAPVIDATWSPWSPEYASSGAAVLSPAGSYAQYRARFFTPTSASPVLHDVSLAFEHFASSGEVVTEPFLATNLARWGRVEMDGTVPPVTSLSVALSQDQGTSWTPLVPGANLTGATPGAIALRFTLTTGNTTLTPTVRSVSVGFELAGESGGGGILYLPVVGPFWLLLIPFVILAAWILATSLRRKPFDATDLFLIHADGRLVLRVGKEESPLRDEIAVSGMFTLVAQFVKDSFHGEGGRGGELRNFQVDDRKVTIARSEFLFLALIGRGTPPPEAEANLARFLRRLEKSQRAILFAWDGFRDHLGGTEAILDRFLRKGYRSRNLLSRRSGI